MAEMLWQRIHEIFIYLFIYFLFYIAKSKAEQNGDTKKRKRRRRVQGMSSGDETVTAGKMIPVVI